MSTKKTDLIFQDEKIILRSVYDKADIRCFIMPCKNKNGQYPPCVKQVNEHGQMILSDNERNDWAEGRKAFIGVNQLIEIYSGKVFDLRDMHQEAEWRAIENCPLIAKSRDERDEHGELKIDGAKSTIKKPSRIGVAEFYIDRPGLDTQRRISRKELVHKAESFIYEDPNGSDGRLNMARILGKNMSGQTDADVKDYLLRLADKDPKKIIEVYTGGDTSLRLLFIEAKEKKIIYIKNKLYMYADNIVLGATDDAVINWMKEAKNQKVLELIRKDTFPDYYETEK